MGIFLTFAAFELQRGYLYQNGIEFRQRMIGAGLNLFLGAPVTERAIKVLFFSGVSLFCLCLYELVVFVSVQCRTLFLNLDNSNSGLTPYTSISGLWSVYKLHLD